MIVTAVMKSRPTVSRCNHFREDSREGERDREEVCVRVREYVWDSKIEGESRREGVVEKLGVGACILNDCWFDWYINK